MCKSKSDSANNGAILKHLAQQEYHKTYRDKNRKKLRKYWREYKRRVRLNSRRQSTN